MPQQKYTNRLIREKSPYLLQHAHNPVDWYPWGDEAFEKAQREDKPVFLSIGYSACHWCHVMERESFENEEAARLLNENFVSVKVDREERPDIDHIYMEACLALTGSGGWPLNCFLTPDKRPFYAGTYFPREDSMGMTGFLSILTSISALWRKNRAGILDASEKVTAHISSGGGKSRRDAPPALVHQAFEQLKRSYDRQNGGFGTAPKFPSAHTLLFLMQYGLLFDNGEALSMAEHTLDCMANGGIFDQVGGGFCRYSVDRQWLIPHFEKMMMDNAMMALAYCEAGAALDRGFFKTAERTLQYCLAEMRDENGGFYTAQDADSEGVEGRYYVFTPGEVEAALGSRDGGRFCELYGITGQGNFEGKSVPNLIGEKLSPADEEFAQRCLAGLRLYRAKRVPPFLDDKILASVNGLMAAALARAGRLMNKREYLAAAEKTAVFIRENMTAGGRLMAGWRGGLLPHPATSDDYAYAAWGYYELYQATLKPQWLRAAVETCDGLLRLFRDERGGGLFLSGSDVHDLPLRSKNEQDGAHPSGNSVAANLLLRLSLLLDNREYRTQAEHILRALLAEAAGYPSASAWLLTAQLFALQGGTLVTVAGGKGEEEMAGAALRAVNPFSVVALCGEGHEEMEKIASVFQHHPAVQGSAAAYICTGGACLPPETQPERVSEIIRDALLTRSRGKAEKQTDMGAERPKM